MGSQPEQILLAAAATALSAVVWFYGTGLRAIWILTWSSMN
jgi:hypothetical protein